MLAFGRQLLLVVLLASASARPGAGNPKHCPVLQVQRQVQGAGAAADRDWMPACDPLSGRGCSNREMQAMKVWTAGPRRQAEDALLQLQGEFDALAGSVWSDAQRREKLEDINVLTKLLYGSR